MSSGEADEHIFMSENDSSHHQEDDSNRRTAGQKVGVSQLYFFAAKDALF